MSTPPSFASAPTCLCLDLASAGTCPRSERHLRPVRSRPSLVANFLVEGVELVRNHVLVERTEKEGWAVVSDAGVTIALDTTLDDELRLEARVYDAIHRVNIQRKNMGLDISDRIHLSLPAAEANLLQHRDWIMAETLALRINASADNETLIERVD